MSIRSSTKPYKVYKFVHNTDECIITSIVDKYYKSGNGFIELTQDGKIFINGSRLNGYAWDGCTPKFEFLDFVIGTPDGRLDYLTEKPITYYASLVHDAIYQYKSEIPVCRKDADIIFLKILSEAGFYWSWVYYIIIRLFGGFYGKWKAKSNTKNLRLLESSWIKRTVSSLVAKEVDKHAFMKVAVKYKK